MSQDVAVVVRFDAKIYKNEETAGVFMILDTRYSLCMKDQLVKPALWTTRVQDIQSPPESSPNVEQGITKEATGTS